uniref:protein sidekick-2-like n=1 Tax=Myxine glutinosa TaxID=7769 RepID=UPI00358F1309
MGEAVFYKTAPKHDGNESERIRVLYLPETSVRLKGLEGFTRYSVRIIAYNTAGLGPSSSIATGRTLPAAPSAPSFIHFADVLTSSLNVSWGEPAQPNGLLEGYHVLYHPITPVPEVNKAVIVDVKKSSPRWIRFTGLTPRVSYSFRVKGMTFTYGPEVSGNVTMAPAEGAPGPPGRPMVVQNGADLQLQWSRGSSGHSHITGYVIEARPAEGGEWDLLVSGIERQATGHTIRSNLLHAGVAYILRVSATNRVGVGSPSPPSRLFTAQSAVAFYDEWWFLVVVALSGLLLILLLIFVLIVRGQSQHKRQGSSGVIVLLERRSSPLSEVFCTLEQVLLKDLSVFGYIQCSLYPYKSLSPCH